MWLALPVPRPCVKGGHLTAASTPGWGRSAPSRHRGPPGPPPRAGRRPPSPSHNPCVPGGTARPGRQLRAGRPSALVLCLATRRWHFSWWPPVATRSLPACRQRRLSRCPVAGAPRRVASSDSRVQAVRPASQSLRWSWVELAPMTPPETPAPHRPQQPRSWATLRIGQTCAPRTYRLILLHPILVPLCDALRPTRYYACAMRAHAGPCGCCRIPKA
jgi:hypothetical protein